MPRIYASNSDPIDYCRRCFPQDYALGYVLHGLVETGAGPDGRGDCFGYDCDHPEYTDTDYDCHKCGKRLTSADD
jgi:hypothetical protein